MVRIHDHDLYRVRGVDDSAEEIARLRRVESFLVANRETSRWQVFHQESVVSLVVFTQAQLQCLHVVGYPRS